MPVPFDFSNACRFEVFDEETGFDYALVHVRTLYRMSLEKNGIYPLDERAWSINVPEECDRYFLLGHPTSLIRQFSGGFALFENLFIPLERIAKPEYSTASTERFYARIIPSLGSLATIDGVSGGPIFGFLKCDEGVRYWALAVQSGWFPDKGVVIGCYLRQFLEACERHLATAGFQTGAS